ncbi:hypothetical protein M8C21_012976, partial [Ambrosia artemisiifolia]
GAPRTALKLLDTGNAVLINVTSGSILWQSFDTPTDTFLPGMIKGTNIKLTSWKSVTDPGSGRFKFQTEPGTTPYSILKGSSTYHWKSGKMSTNSFDDNQISSNVFNLLSNTTTQKVQNISGNGTISFENYTVVDPNSRLVMGHSGKLQYFYWLEEKRQWDLEWEEPKDDCSVYKVCGPFGMCKETNNSSLCSCLPGFEPVSPDDPTDGCKRTSEICDKTTNDTFINITMISMDDTTLPFVEADNESACIKKCLQSCDCLAYSYSSQDEGRIRGPSRENTHRCWLWNTQPSNLKCEGTHNISFRVSESSSRKISGISAKPKTERKSWYRKLILAKCIIGSALGLSLFCGISYITYKRLVNYRNQNQNNVEFLSGNTRTRINELLHLDHSNEDDMEGPDVPYF